MDEGLAAAKTEMEVAAAKFADLRKQAIANKGQGKGKRLIVYVGLRLRELKKGLGKG